MRFDEGPPRAAPAHFPYRDDGTLADAWNVERTSKPTSKTSERLEGTSAERASERFSQREASEMSRLRLIPSGGPQHRIPKVDYTNKVKVRGKRGRVGALTLLPSHPAVREARTLFPKSVVGAAETVRLLVDGYNSRKVGKRVTKGAWSGMPIFTLTLEERATCPTSCAQWLSCYGNKMHLARRHRLDEDLLVVLRAELEAKQQRHPSGFVVRAHVLGDFGSEADEDLALTYVELWHVALREMPGLRMFSYTAHAPDSAIGLAIQHMNACFPDRCRVRFSGHAMGGEGAVVIERLEDSQHVVCPAQTGQTDCCATCALCWSMDRTVEFLRH